MKVTKYNEEVEKEYPYELTDQGELKKAKYEFGNIRYVYLTDEQYEKLKNLANNTKEMCDLLEEKKKTYIKMLIGAIQEIKKR
jgi:hypothetical protein